MLLGVVAFFVAIAFASSIESDAKAEVHTLLRNGPSSNVFDIVLLGEGYTELETAKFKKDVARVVQEGFGPDGLYFSISPFLNIHSVSTPSRNSGVGMEGSPKDTAFRLFREKGTLRSILPTDEDNFSYNKALGLCKQFAPGCDIAIVLVNDPFYGGLGDEVAIISASKSSGMIAMRHELGHIFADIGEEYDGGEDYSGPNFAETNRICTETDKPKKSAVDLGGGQIVQRDIWPCIPWSHWLSDSSKKTEVTPQPSQMLFMDHPWASIETAPFRGKFSSRGAERLRVEFSISGAAGPGELVLKLDGNVFKRFILPENNDRVFFHAESDRLPLVNGAHKFSLTMAKDLRSAEESVKLPRHGPSTICHLGIWEYYKNFEKTTGFVGAYPVYQKPGVRLGYRPTDNSCLMRSMESERLCPVCNERIWQRLSERTNLIENVVVQGKRIKVNTLPFGTIRKPKILPGENVWIKLNRCKGSKEGSNAHIVEDEFEITVDLATGCWEVHVQVVSAEVRKGFIGSSGTFIVPSDVKPGSAIAVTPLKMKERVAPDSKPVPSSHSTNSEAKGKAEVDKRKHSKQQRIASGADKKLDRATPQQGEMGSSPAHGRELETKLGTKHVRTHQPAYARKSNMVSVLVVDLSYVCGSVLLYCCSSVDIRKRLRRRFLVWTFLLATIHFAVSFSNPTMSSRVERTNGNTVGERTQDEEIRTKVHPTIDNVAINVSKGQAHQSKTGAMPSDPGPLVPTTPVSSNTEKASPEKTGAGPKPNTPKEAGSKAPAMSPKSCRSERYGKDYAVDDGGYICPRFMLEFTSGCCPRASKKGMLRATKLQPSKRYQCDRCHQRMQCCKNYEMCVSCCMGQPEMQSLKSKTRRLLAPVPLVYNGLKIFKSPDCGSSDPFLKCKCRCRTHSQMTRHENSYESPWHFCYHKTPPKRDPPVLFAGDVGESCDHVCKRHDDKVCEDHDLIAVNTCENLRSKFPCAGDKCEKNHGSDQPAMSIKGNACYINTNTQYISCSGEHESTRRLCPCRKRWGPPN